MAKKKPEMPRRGTPEWAAMILEAMDSVYPYDQEKVSAFREKMDLPSTGKQTWKRRTEVLALELGACIAELTQLRLLAQLFTGSLALAPPARTGDSEDLASPGGADTLLYVPGDGNA